MITIIKARKEVGIPKVLCKAGTEARVAMALEEVLTMMSTVQEDQALRVTETMDNRINTDLAAQEIEIEADTETVTTAVE